MTDINFESLVRHSMDIVAVVDRDTRLRYANPAAERILGVEVGQELGRTTADRVHPDDLALVIDRLVAITSGEPSGVPISFRVADADGDWHVLQFVGSNQLDDPAVRGIVLNGRDVTDQHRLADALERSLEKTLGSLAMVVEVRDPNTAGHQTRVAELAGALAHALTGDGESAKGIIIAALLHDIGKMAVPAEILLKPGALSSAERAVIQDHPHVGHGVICDIEFPWPVAQMVLEHHERCDGSGYPNHRHGDQLLLGSKIVAVADVVEAMVAHRTYRAASPIATALEELRQGAGTRYDTHVVDTCVDLFERGFEFSGID